VGGPAMHEVGRLLGLISLAVAVPLVGGVAQGVLRHRRVADVLATAAHPATIEDQEVGLVPGIEAAVVAGLYRPRIYCSGELMERLDAEELRAVILHEQHHQLHRAPLRLVVLGALAPFVAWSGPGRQWLDVRRAGIEIAADGYALGLGVPRAVLAMALVKLLAAEPTMSRAGFASAADLRLRALLDDTATPDARSRHWTSWALAVVAFVTACAVLAAV
jgi:beta-lactamase regulating signal transducer with metallopeptidase domain